MHRSHFLFHLVVFSHSYILFHQSFLSRHGISCNHRLFRHQDVIAGIVFSLCLDTIHHHSLGHTDCGMVNSQGRRRFRYASICIFRMCCRNLALVGRFVRMLSHACLLRVGRCGICLSHVMVFVMQ